MQFNELITPHALTIDSVKPNEIVINGQIYTHHLCIGRKDVYPIMHATPQNLSMEDFITAIEDNADLILIGTGQMQQFLPAPLLVKMAQQGVGIESMNTAAACRTYTLLTGEGRNVWAWLWL